LPAIQASTPARTCAALAGVWVAADWLCANPGAPNGKAALAAASVVAAKSTSERMAGRISCRARQPENPVNEAARPIAARQSVWPGSACIFKHSDQFM
jgi:hypothetical protein